MSISTAEPERLTYEEAQAEVRRIVARLDEDDVPVSEICELTARGKALVAVQRSYLAEQQARIEEIEAGENLPPFEIVASLSQPAATAAPAAGADEAGSTPEPTVEVKPPASKPGPPPADDDIPF